MKINIYYKILVLAYGFSTFSEGILLPIYAIFVQKVGGDILDAAGAIAVYFILQGVFEILIHRTSWSQRQRKTLMVVGWLLWLVGIGSYLLIHSVAMLFIAQTLTGLGNAVANPAFDAELAEKTDKKISSYEYSVFEGLQDIFQGIAAILGGLVATTFGFTSLLVLMVISASVSFMLIIHYLYCHKKYS